MGITYEMGRAEKAGVIKIIQKGGNHNAKTRMG
nr:MAG TPA: hypothetical protein [Caudoviricetes sp.]